MDYFKLLRNENVADLDKYLKTHDVNEDIYDQSLLYWAVYENSYAFTQRLIQHGVNVNKKDKLNRTVLHIACYFGFYNIAKLLLQNGAIRDTTCFERALSGWDGHYQSEIIDLLRKYAP
ncbi:ankyrin repeat domain-containing protein [Fredinandcohnia sp. QZ13]|uniref:ankyrin repeat domain-containing protein n=1 Tax=Fredinandcohnia sp. QZ13 TaxID=3073144 RepID=UPI002853519E|nr:ankyrin repeat domain-containing protein [Fredinandcohnia sp. QZ13]MDR4887519.1 ankyrin repeat domain-containing protein [Fredinandcohnia sp. QZ13]